MINVEAAKAILSQAERRLETARREARRGSPAYAIRSAQECVELSLKAALRFVGIEYPKQHDVSKVLLRARDRLPEWFEVEKLARISTWLAERREPAMYGDEARGITSDELFPRKEADKAANYAQEIHSKCKKLILA